MTMTLARPSVDHHCAVEPSPPARIVEQRRDRGVPTSAHVASWTGAESILCIANRFWDLMPLGRDQKLFPHLGEAGTAVFAVEEVEYGGHDPISLFELICTISCKLSAILGPRCELDHSRCARTSWGQGGLFFGQPLGSARSAPEWRYTALRNSKSV